MAFVLARNETERAGSAPHRPQAQRDAMPYRTPSPPKAKAPPAPRGKAGYQPSGAVSQLWERLRAMRRFAGLRQQDVAQHLNKSRATIALWESHLEAIRTRPSADDVRAYAELCKVPVTFALDNRAHPDDVWRAQGNGVAPAATDAPRVPQAPAPAVPNLLLGMQDRTAQMFFTAVEFGVANRTAEKIARFPHDGGPDYVHNGHAVVFASDAVDAKSLLIGAMAVLLQYERSAGREHAKHILVYAGTGGAKINEAEAAKLWGARVVQIDNVNEAVRYLQAL